jgi:NTP pyrophosphatase (non-canonical NTP hydrolase)
VERRYELENRRRSLAMLQPRANAGLLREEAIELIEEVHSLQQRLERLRDELRRLAED